jgi:ferredoxin-NADP reductase
MQASIARQFKLPLTKKIKESTNIWSFYFDRTKLIEKYNFLPGQYNRITLPMELSDGKGNNRQFTISSSPTDKNYLTITTKIEEKKTDFKSELLNFAIGQEVEFFGPLGGFFLIEKDKSPRVFLAGGVGITPFHSMIKYISDKNLNIKVTLIASFSKIEEIVFYNELKKIASQDPNIKIIYTITNQDKSHHDKIAKANSSKIFNGYRVHSAAQNNIFETGRISEELIIKHLVDLKLSEFMIVGPPNMVDNTFDLLQKMKIKEDKIKVEQFTGY